MESIWNINIMEYIIAVIYGRSAFLVIEVNGYIIKEEYMTVISPLPNFDVKDFHCQYTVFSASCHSNFIVMVTTIFLDSSFCFKLLDILAPFYSHAKKETSK